MSKAAIVGLVLSLVLMALLFFAGGFFVGLDVGLRQNPTSSSGHWPPPSADKRKENSASGNSTSTSSQPVAGGNQSSAPTQPASLTPLSPKKPQQKKKEPSNKEPIKSTVARFPSNSSKPAPLLLPARRLTAPSTLRQKAFLPYLKTTPPTSIPESSITPRPVSSGRYAPSMTSQNASSLYSLQVGVYTSLEEAEKIARYLKRYRYRPYIRKRYTPTGKIQGYVVRAGNFLDLDTAEWAAAQFRQAGFKAVRLMRVRKI